MPVDPIELIQHPERFETHAAAPVPDPHAEKPEPEMTEKQREKATRRLTKEENERSPEERDVLWKHYRIDPDVEPDTDTEEE